MSFAQHTRIEAQPGKQAELLRKFLDAVELQRDNPACRLMMVSSSPSDEDAVFLTEVWSTEDEWERARSSPEVGEWAGGMPSLVAGPPQTTPLEVAGASGLRAAE